MSTAMGRLCLAAWVAAISCVFAEPGDRSDRRYTIETTGTARAAPDLLHLMMKMEWVWLLWNDSPVGWMETPLVLFDMKEPVAVEIPA
mgnify:CR=1 FL=1